MKLVTPTASALISLKFTVTTRSHHKLKKVQVNLPEIKNTVTYLKRSVNFAEKIKVKTNAIKVNLG